MCRYAQFVEALEAASRDNLDFIKSKAIKALGTLLAAKPEQEARLLAALVNKLGDPSRKLASKVRICGMSGARCRSASSAALLLAAEPVQAARLLAALVDMLG